MFLFRIDLGSKYGLGHYSRIKSFTRYLNIKNYKIIIDNELNAHHIKNEKNLIFLYEKKNKFKNERQDAEIFLKTFKKNIKDSIVVKDSFRLNFDWEKYISKYCKKLIVICDNINQKHSADFYINHNPRFIKLNKFDKEKIKGKNKKGCNFLLGPNFSLFNSQSKKKKIISDIIFSNGGSGNLLVYEKVIKNLLKNQNRKYNILLIVGPYSKNFREIKEKFGKYNNVRIINNQDNILDFLIGTKLFVSAAGVSIFESSFLKVPSLLFRMNNNQILSDTDYENIGHFFVLDKPDLNYPQKISQLIQLMLLNLDKIKSMMTPFQLNYRNIRKNYVLKFKNL